jgi:GT2 family glycosyltransferase
MITYLLPTRNRPERFAATLAALAGLSAGEHDRVGGAEVVVVDDGSDAPARGPKRLANGFAVEIVRLGAPRGAAARNEGAGVARGEWIVMLDDDSHPCGASAVAPIADAAPDVAAIGGEIVVPERTGRAARREDGGLPEVFVGCGAIVRRSAFLAAGGYDPAFHYYAEEYDLCARLIAAGWRIVHDWRFRVIHEKTASGRDMNLIVQRLVRNNGWVVQRYAPAAERENSLATAIARCRAIAEREGARAGFAVGLAELFGSLDRQERRPLDGAQWARFTGLAAARATLAALPELAGAEVAVVDEGKHADLVRAALRERGAVVGREVSEGVRRMIGTLSPGPMMDAWDRRSALGERVLRAWTPRRILAS